MSSAPMSESYAPSVEMVSLPVNLCMEPLYALKHKWTPFLVLRFFRRLLMYCKNTLGRCLQQR